MDNCRIGIIGATGFTGIELVRILSRHPDVEIAVITSESKAGMKYSDINPHFRGVCDLHLQSIKELDKDEVDFLFLALPHRVSMDFVKDKKDWKVPMVDLSGDFRLNDAETYEKWYNKKHVIPKKIGEAAYGLSELNAKAISQADLIANPGCFPTSAILPLAPLIANEKIDTQNIIVDSKSGVTGAGATSKDVNHFCNANENFMAYGLKTHRHTIEIQQALGNLVNKGEGEVRVQFTPHLLPLDRGILSTIYVKPGKGITDEALRNMYREFYAGQPFVRIVDAPPGVKQVRGSNYCDIYTTFDERTGNIIATAAIDNLVKGAAGQAVHNMNLRMDFDVQAGLNYIPLQP